MSLLLMDGCDIAITDRNKWSYYGIGNDGSRIKFLPTGGVWGGGAYQLDADNDQFSQYVAYLINSRKNWILATLSDKTVGLPNGTTTKISFWMKCTPAFNESITRTMPFMMLDNSTQTYLTAFSASGLMLFLDNNGRISIRQLFITSDNQQSFVQYNVTDFLRTASPTNDHARLDDGNYHHIEISISIIDLNTSLFTLHVDGNFYGKYDSTLTYATNANYLPKFIDMVRFFSIPDMNLVLDDIFVWQDVEGTEFTGFKGPLRISSVIATANSTPSDSTPSQGTSTDKWTLIGGTPYNNSWTLNQTWVSMPIGGKDLYEMSNISSLETIYGLSYTMNYGSSYKEPTATPPSLVTSDLILHLDAADVNSFPGVGSVGTSTTWYDISGYNKHATFINTPSYNPTANSFDFASDDYMIGSQTYNSPSLPTGSNPRTIIAGFRAGAIENRYQTIIHYGQNSTGRAYGLVLVGSGSTASSQLGIHTWSGNSYMGEYPILAGRDYIAAVRYDDAASPRHSFFVNGVFGRTVNDYSINTGTTYEYYISSRVQPFTEPLGTSAADGRIYFVLVYNRALSDSEIEQVYDNLKYRFPELSSMTNYANVRPVLVSNGVTYNGTTKSTANISYSETTEFLYTDFGSSNTTWTIESINSLLAGFENVG